MSLYLFPLIYVITLSFMPIISMQVLGFPPQLNVPLLPLSFFYVGTLNYRRTRKKNPPFLFHSCNMSSFLFNSQWVSFRIPIAIIPPVLLTSLKGLPKSMEYCVSWLLSECLKTPLVGCLAIVLNIPLHLECKQDTEPT
jgi:hypothetical protein